MVAILVQPHPSDRRFFESTALFSGSCFSCFSLWLFEERRVEDELFFLRVAISRSVSRLESPILGPLSSLFLCLRALQLVPELELAARRRSSSWAS